MVPDVDIGVFWGETSLVDWQRCVSFVQDRQEEGYAGA
jgi:hypothetical protein